MNCPHCQKRIDAFTGLQELQKFQKHLAKCKKNPNNLVDRDVFTGKTIVTPQREQTLNDALELRAASEQ